MWPAAFQRDSQALAWLGEPLAVMGLHSTPLDKYLTGC